MITFNTNHKCFGRAGQLCNEVILLNCIIETTRLVGITVPNTSPIVEICVSFSIGSKNSVPFHGHPCRVVRRVKEENCTLLARLFTLFSSMACM